MLLSLMVSFLIFNLFWNLKKDHIKRNNFLLINLIHKLMRSKILKKALLIMTGIFIQNSVNAQMYVGPDSYVFANNEVVFLKQQLELNATTSNFYLRQDAQLLQGTTLAGANKGTGSLSV